MRSGLGGVTWDETRIVACGAVPGNVSRMRVYLVGGATVDVADADGQLRRTSRLDWLARKGRGAA